MGMGERGRQTSLALLWKADDPVRSPWLDKLNAPLAVSGAYRYKKADSLPASACSCFRYNEGAPLQTSSPSCNSTVLAPRKPPCYTGSPVHDLPSQSVRSNGGVTQQLRCFGHFLALTVPSAVGFDPKFLLSCCLTMSRRYNKQPRGVPELDLSSFS